MHHVIDFTLLIQNLAKTPTSGVILSDLHIIYIHVDFFFFFSVPIGKNK